MQKKRVDIFFKERAWPAAADAGPACYFLSDDYSRYSELKEKFKGTAELRNLSGIFDRMFQEIKPRFLALISDINKRNDSTEWWGGQTASRNTASTPLLRNINYLFCARKLIAAADNDISFIVDSSALAECISSAASLAGREVRVHGERAVRLAALIKRMAYYAAQIGFFVLHACRNKAAALKYLKQLPVNKASRTKRAVIRSWVTGNVFSNDGKYKDRNFGPLLKWLKDRGYEVWILPMFFNLSRPLCEIYSAIGRQEQSFLIPDLYLKISDYFGALRNSFRVMTTRVVDAEIDGTDVAPIFAEVIKKCGFDPSLSLLNLCYPLLNRLKERGYEIDAFYYPFENNPPEKQFILGCRKFFPGAKVTGFQHTTFFPNQMAYHLGPSEKDFHPLPDGIVCSGPAYMGLHRDAGFPPEILVQGPNLRFDTVYSGKGSETVDAGGAKKLILPLTFSHDLAFELFVKVNDALKGAEGFEVYVRSHPLLSRKKLQKFLDDSGMRDWKFADGGTIQEWLPRMYAVVTTGASVTVLEAVAAGVPVVRVVPDNTFHYDAFHWRDYPLQPVNGASGIKEQLDLIGAISQKDAGAFQKLSGRLLNDYFTEPNDENMKVFL